MQRLLSHLHACTVLQASMCKTDECRTSDHCTAPLVQADCIAVDLSSRRWQCMLPANIHHECSLSFSAYPAPDQQRHASSTPSNSLTLFVLRTHRLFTNFSVHVVCVGSILGLPAPACPTTAAHPFAYQAHQEEKHQCSCIRCCPSESHAVSCQKALCNATLHTDDDSSCTLTSMFAPACKVGPACALKER